MEDRQSRAKFWASLGSSYQVTRRWSRTSVRCLLCEFSFEKEVLDKDSVFMPWGILVFQYTVQFIQESCPETNIKWTFQVLPVMSRI